MKRHAMVDVQSSNLSQIGHQGGHLLVRFKDGQLYRYEDVPHDVYLKLIAADSPGRAIREHVFGKYRHRKLDV